tara:strand:+ start:4849 stop:6984 length:2136 start_codon:yes stop_codon:yes gene_type:complete
MRWTGLTRTIFSLLAIGLFPSISTYGQHNYKDLEYPPLNDIQAQSPTRVVLGNGIVLYLVEDHRLPMINLSARIGVGAVNEPANRIGLAGITGSVMRTGGSTNMSGDDIDETLESIGASVETGIGRISGFASMSVLKNNINIALPILADILMNPAFPDDKIELEKISARSSIARRNDNPTNIGFREFSKLIYGPESVYARHSEYATIEEITREDLITFHQKWFHPNNTMLGVWGDFDSDEMVKQISEAFSKWKSGGFRRPTFPPVDYKFDRSINLIRRENINQSTVVLGHIGGLMNNSDYFALQVMNDILSGGFSGRLFRNVRSEQGLAYAVFGTYSANYSYPGIFYVGCITKSETTGQAIRSLLNEIRRMKTDKITEQELSLAKESFLNSFVFNFDTRREIINRKMTYEYYGYPPDFLEQTKDKVEKVSAADVQRVARKYLQPDKTQIIVVGNDQTFDEELTFLGPVNEIDVRINAPLLEVPNAGPQASIKGRSILRNSVEIMGGFDAFASVESIETTATVKIKRSENEIVIELRSLVSFPDRARLIMETPMGKITRLLIGNQAWIIDPTGARQQAPPRIKDSMTEGLWHNLIFLYCHINNQNMQIQSLGNDHVEGRETEVLLITPPNLNPFKLFLDKETMIPLKISRQNISQQGPILIETMLSDYRVINGMKLPFRITNTHNGEQADTFSIQTVTINPDIPPTVFEQPK